MITTKSLADSNSGTVKNTAEINGVHINESTVSVFYSVKKQLKSDDSELATESQPSKAIDLSDMKNQSWWSDFETYLKSKI